MKFQDFVIKQCNAMRETLGTEKERLNEPAYAYAIKGLLDKYPITYQFGNGDICTYAKCLNNKNKDYIFNKLLFSKKARAILEEYRTTNHSYLKETLYGEHLTPMSYVRRKIINSNNIEEVANAFYQCKYLVITKEESKILDSSGSKFTREFIEEVISTFALSDTVQEELQSLEGKAMKSNRLGVARMYYLYKRGIEFTDINNSELTFDDWMSYLEDDEFIL